MMQCKERVEAYLREHQVPFQEQQHARAFSALRIAESEHVSSKHVAKTVIMHEDGQMVCFVLPATYQVDLEKARAVLGAKEVRLAQEADFSQQFPDCEVGSMPPFGNLYGLPVYVDQSLAAEESIVFPVGTYTDTMMLKFADFDHLVHPHITTLIKEQPGR